MKDLIEDYKLRATTSETEIAHWKRMYDDILLDFHKCEAKLEVYKEIAEYGIRQLLDDIKYKS